MGILPVKLASCKRLFREGLTCWGPETLLRVGGTRDALSPQKKASRPRRCPPAPALAMKSGRES